MMGSTPTTQEVANAFLTVLAEWLIPEELAQVHQRNAAEPHPGVCHSHDFCDANMAMFEAFGRTGLINTYGPGEDDLEGASTIINSPVLTALWDKAWTLALPHEEACSNMNETTS